MYVLKTEIKKLLSYTTFWVLLGICLFSIVMLILASVGITNKMSINTRAVNVNPWFEFPEVWETVTSVASYLSLFFISIITITLVCNEYTFRTIRQNVIDGLSRFELVLGKLSVIVGLSLIVTFFTGIVCLVFGFFYSKNVDASTMFTKLSCLGDFFLQAMAYGVAAYAIATICKSTGISIVVFFAYKIVIEWVADLIVLPGSSGDYLPMNLFSSLTPSPVDKIAASLQGMPPQVIGHPTIELLALLYMVILIGITYFFIAKRDL